MTARTRTLTLVAALGMSLPSACLGGAVSLLGEGFFGQPGAALVQARQEMPAPAGRAAFIDVRRGAPGEQGRGSGASLFAGHASGLFAPLPPRGTRRYRDLGGAAIAPLGPDATDVQRLRLLIAHAEAGAADYDAINYGARRLPSRPPTEMTLGEVYAWIAATPGQPHAIGRYQFIPSTLKRLAREIGAGEHERFSPRMQDRLADELFAEAGLAAAREGLMGRRQFMNNLAKIWAGLPNSSGRSHYEGHAGNRATMTWASFEAEMATIFPS